MVGNLCFAYAWLVCVFHCVLVNLFYLARCFLFFFNVFIGLVVFCVSVCQLCVCGCRYLISSIANVFINVFQCVCVFVCLFICFL